MRTARSSSHPGGLLQCMLGYIPLGVGLETPQARPLNFPLGCEPGDTPLARPLNFLAECGPGNLQGMLGYHPLTPLDMLQGMLQLRAVKI